MLQKAKAVAQSRRHIAGSSERHDTKHISRADQAVHCPVVVIGDGGWEIPGICPSYST
jgi:hypothetical protein